MAKIIFTISLVCIVFLSICTPVRAEEAKDVKAIKQDVALTAFNLRMGGQIDKALNILKQSASKDPNNAAVQYATKKFLCVSWSVKPALAGQHYVRSGTTASRRAIGGPNPL